MMVLAISKERTSSLSLKTITSTIIYLLWCPKDRTYLEYFIDFTGTWEERSEGIDLSHDAADSPQVDG